MAGHSKWANIRFRKGKADAIKGKLFSRVTKEIISAVKQGGPDPKANVRLRAAIQKAKAVNMPSDNVERNIKKAASSDQADFTSIIYELYGHGGVGILIQILTDNKNRVASDIRTIIHKKGGTLATPGSVTFNFDQKGVIRVLKKAAHEDKLFAVVIEAGAEDFEVADDLYLITTPSHLLNQVKEAIEKLHIKCEAAELEMIPKVEVECDAEQTEANLELIDSLENLDDVDEVFHNLKVSG